MLSIARQSVLLQALGGGEAPSSVFGGEHLLRLFVRLPQLLPMATLPPTAAEVLEAHLKQFIAWMASHQKELFLPSGHYRCAPCKPCCLVTHSSWCSTQQPACGALAVVHRLLSCRRAVVQQHVGALSAPHSGAAMGAPTAAEVVAAVPPRDLPGHASGADMNGNGSDMVA